ncbi:hypothetical protein ISN45_Aa05g011390 [Arabidopsis thaliana x Arabidopsis arenosa]|uniref:Uncharacterized protein n=1 Tax=Arabidopsis thaliana x Arabidopsis arenosa TaxID=1240361 RepID=A0A8T1ZJQ8_9BRAS|nr:hypothetical protein ISN45_Aa05g011390 [Arabidopsis thaliana x Arabidopsis arenosa]
MLDGEDNHGSISWHQDDYSDSESRDEPDREAPESEPPDSYNTNKGYSKPWIKLNDDFYSHGSKSPLTRVISFSGKENYLKWEEDMEYKGAIKKEYHYQRPQRREEKPNHHILSHRVPTTSCQAKPRDKYIHTNPRVVQELTQEVTQGASIWLKQHPRGRRDCLAEKDSRTRRERDYLQWELNMDKYFRYYERQANPPAVGSVLINVITISLHVVVDGHNWTNASIKGCWWRRRVGGQGDGAHGIESDSVEGVGGDGASITVRSDGGGRKSEVVVGIKGCVGYEGEKQKQGFSHFRFQFYKFEFDFALSDLLYTIKQAFGFTRSP